MGRYTGWIIVIIILWYTGALKSLKRFFSALGGDSEDKRKKVEDAIGGVTVDSSKLTRPLFWYSNAANQLYDLMDHAGTGDLFSIISDSLSKDDLLQLYVEYGSRQVNFFGWFGSDGDKDLVSTIKDELEDSPWDQSRMQAIWQKTGLWV